jgi:ubiquinone/menaquinone biosynthesis C-methylase UbiE
MDSNGSRSHRDAIVDQFSRQAEPYSRWRGHSQDRAIRRLLRAVRVTPDDTVLDVACGPGLLTLAFAEVAGRATGLDATPAMISRARALQAERGARNVEWFVGEAARLPFEDGTFTVVACRYSLHHVLAPASVVAEMVRVCAPGGRVALVDVVTTAATEAAFNDLERLRDPSHVRALRREELIGLAKNSGLARARISSYTEDFEVDALLQASFPAPGDAARVHTLFNEDVGRDRLGLHVTRRAASLHVSYPIALIVGEVRGR